MTPNIMYCLLFNFTVLEGCMKTIPGEMVTTPPGKKPCEICTEMEATVILDDLAFCTALGFTCEESKLVIPVPAAGQCTAPIMQCSANNDFLVVEINGQTIAVPADEVGAAFDYHCLNNDITTVAQAPYPDGAVITKAACASKPCAKCATTTLINANLCSQPEGGCTSTLTPMNYKEQYPEANGYCKTITITPEKDSWFEFVPETGAAPAPYPPIASGPFLQATMLLCDSNGKWILVDPEGTMTPVKEINMYTRKCKMCTAASLITTDLSFCPVDYECESPVGTTQNVDSLDGCSKMEAMCGDVHGPVLKYDDGTIEEVFVDIPGLQVEMTCNAEGTLFLSPIPPNTVTSMLCAKKI